MPGGAASDKADCEPPAGKCRKYAPWGNIRRRRQEASVGAGRGRVADNHCRLRAENARRGLVRLCRSTKPSCDPRVVVRTLDASGRAPDQKYVANPS
jgi:hypothetical protein